MKRAKPQVLIAAAECAPLAKLGGLADVVGALPKFLPKAGWNARVIMPNHRSIKQHYGDKVQHLFDFEVTLGWRHQYAGIEKLRLGNTIYYLVDNEFYFGNTVYAGGDFECEQYAMFSRAVCDAIPHLDFDPQVIHCNDWHTAMIPLMLKAQYAGAPQHDIKTLLTIHNLMYQGKFDPRWIQDVFGLSDCYDAPLLGGPWTVDNMLLAGVLYAERVNTVSPTYANEICTPDFGEGLDGYLRMRRDNGTLSGILNGIDTNTWNPASDPMVGCAFDAADLSGKQQAKRALLAELGLQDDTEAPLLSMVGRLYDQKGVDLLQQTLDQMVQRGAMVVVLGSGDPLYQDWLRQAEQRLKGRVCAYIGYNNELAHRIYAGSDFFLMPSRFEPCGISQMISMAYGTLPIVRETGGLKDTVVPYNKFTGEGTGFSFGTYSAQDLLDAVDRALEVYGNPQQMQHMIENAMGADFGFARCAKSYAEVYKQL